MATHRGHLGDAMVYRWFFGLPTPARLDNSTSRVARWLNLARITRSTYIPSPHDHAE